MKRLVMSVVLAGFLFGCSGGGGDEGTGGGVDPAEQQEAVLAIAKFAVLKQIWFYDLMSTLSDGYTVPFFEGEVTQAEADQLYVQQEALVLAWLEMADALGEEGPEVPGLRRQALTIPEGIPGSGFLNQLIGSAAKSRERILVCVSNMEPHEKDAVVGELEPAWTAEYGIDSFETFVAKLKAGDLDYVAPRIFNKLYYEGEDSHFKEYAQDKGLTMQQIVHKQGAELAKAGGEMLVDTAALVVPGVSKAKDLWDKSVKFEAGVKAIYNDPTGAAVDLVAGAVKGKVVEKLAGFVDVDGAVDAGALGAGAGDAIKWTMNVVTGSDDPKDWVEGALDTGAALFSDAMQADPPEVVVAIKTDGPAPPAAPEVVIQLQTAEARAEGIVLPAGRWELSGASDGPAAAVTEVEVEVPAGQTVEVTPAAPDTPAPAPDTTEPGADTVEPGEDAGGPAPLECADVPGVSGDTGGWQGIDLQFSISGVDVGPFDGGFQESVDEFYANYTLEYPDSYTLGCATSMTMTVDATEALAAGTYQIVIEATVGSTGEVDEFERVYLNEAEGTTTEIAFGPWTTDHDEHCWADMGADFLTIQLKRMDENLVTQGFVTVSLTNRCPGKKD